MSPRSNPIQYMEDGVYLDTTDLSATSSVRLFTEREGGAHEIWLSKSVISRLHDKLMPERTISAFYHEVCRRAERKMVQTGKLEGAHYASMVEIMREMGLMNE